MRMGFYLAKMEENPQNMVANPSHMQPHNIIKKISQIFKFPNGLKFPTLVVFPFRSPLANTTYDLLPYR
jgi:hypothetical protein